MAHDPTTLPAHLPVPHDDGAARHLLGASLPSLSLPSTLGGTRAMSSLARAVVFLYPRTGVPGQPPHKGYAGEDWDDIPGARGCTPQSCGFRDLHTELEAQGVEVLGLSTNSPAHQAEAAARLGLRYALLSDESLALTRALHLPTFAFPVESGGPTTLLRRMVWYVEDATIAHVWYPAFPPQDSAQLVLSWLRARRPEAPSHKPSVP
jgi:peroxiredoxin